MKILVLSDSHLHEIKHNFNDYDYVIHCGDFGRLKDSNNLFYVRGNCDFKGEKEILTHIGNRDIYITHGDLYNVKYGYDKIRYKALEKECSICFFGHTHRADMFIIDNVIFINPGAYQDGYYVVITDTNISFYLENTCYKEFDFKW